MTKSNYSAKLNTAIAFLKGGESVSRDRRAQDAPQIDHIVKKVKGGFVLRTYYGVSNNVQKKLASLATTTDASTGSLPQYFFKGGK